MKGIIDEVVQRTLFKFILTLNLMSKSAETGKVKIRLTMRTTPRRAQVILVCFRIFQAEKHQVMIKLRGTTLQIYVILVHVLQMRKRGRKNELRESC